MKAEILPVSDEVRQAILDYYNMNKGKSKGILGLEPGKNPGELIFHTIKGSACCQIKESNEYIYFIMPSGDGRKVAKKDYLKSIGFIKPC